jgi:aspartyl/glutamyl-tRNA(Asn/Gln) amidotransferase C subunit
MATNEEVQKLASLSRVYIPEEQAETFASEFESILSYVSSLESLTLTALDEHEPGIHINKFREDGAPHAPGAYTEKAVEAFPDKEGNSLKVKQILSHE